MMEHNVMPYESRQATAAPPQRPPLASQYFSSTPFSLAPITNGVPAPQYQPPVTYSGYHSYTHLQSWVHLSEPTLIRNSRRGSCQSSPVLPEGQ